jgi:hypothetical protein
VRARLDSLFSTELYPIADLEFTCVLPQCDATFVLLPPDIANVNPSARRRLETIEEELVAVLSEDDFGSDGGFDVLPPNLWEVAQDQATDEIINKIQSNADDMAALNTKVDANTAKVDANTVKIEALDAKLSHVLYILSAAFPSPAPTTLAPTEQPTAPTTKAPTAPTTKAPTLRPTKHPTNAVTTKASLSLGGNTACVVQLGSGEVFCFGTGTSGQLGNGGVSNSPVPVRVSGISTAKDTCTGLDFSCFHLSDGSVQCTGSNAVGQLGNSQATGDVITPGTVPALSNIAEIACGDQYACAVSESGVLKCWGINFRNVLGIASNPAKRDGPAIPSAAKYGVSGATVYSVAGGVYHTCLVTNGGGVFCTGWNNAGQVGLFLFKVSWNPIVYAISLHPLFAVWVLMAFSVWFHTLILTAF